MQRELSSFPLPPFVRIKLSNAGFITVEDIINLKPSDIDKGRFIQTYTLARCLKGFMMIHTTLARWLNFERSLMTRARQRWFRGIL